MPGSTCICHVLAPGGGTLLKLADAVVGRVQASETWNTMVLVP